MNRMFLVFISGLIGQLALAQEVYENYNGIRYLGMGGAAVAIVNDETALFLNPAGLGRLRNFYGTVFDPEGESTAVTKKMYDKKAFLNPFELEDVKNTADSTRNTHFHAKAQVSPSLVVKNFGFGFHGQKVMNAKMNTAGDSLTINYRDDLAALLGINLRLFEGRIKIGAVGKAIARIEIDKSIDPNGSMDIENHASEGVGIGFDSGIILTAPIMWLPTLSIVGRDIGDTPFTGGSGVRMKSTTRPATLVQDYDIGLAIFPIHSNRSRSTLTVELQKAVVSSKAVDKLRYAHAGYEFNYADILFLRAGVNQRYWTAGLEIASESTQWQLASYGEDIGVDGTPEEDRRYVLKFSFRF